MTGPDPLIAGHSRRARSARGRLAGALPLLLTVLPAVSVAPAAASPPSPHPLVARLAADPVGRWPLHPEPEVVGHFDPPTTPYGAGHRGVDLLGHAGQTVRAALPGTVRYAGPLAGRGVVVVAHGATRTTYEPVDAAVGVGTEVAAGSALGRLQAGPSHCTPRVCLHWGWIEGAETYLDPLRLVGAGPVRLLPLWRGEPVGATARPWSGPPLVVPARTPVSAPVGVPVLRARPPGWSLGPAIAAMGW